MRKLSPESLSFWAMFAVSLVLVGVVLELLRERSVDATRQSDCRCGTQEIGVEARDSDAGTADAGATEPEEWTWL